MTSDMWTVAIEVLDERRRQVTRWGVQHHPDGARRSGRASIYEKRLTDYADRNGSLTWSHILREEVAEALDEVGRSTANLRTELIQVAAVAIAWVEDIDSDQRPTS